MTGRPVQLLTAAAFAVAASFVSMPSASANCYSGCGGYAAPVAYYSAPVVYSYSYAAPVRYASPCSPCGGGYASYGYAAQPMYVVNQGPTFGAAITLPAEEPAYEYGYRRAAPYYAGGGYRWHRRHWNRGYSHRGHGYRTGYGYRGGMIAGPRLRFGYRQHGYRHAYGHRYRTGLVAPRHRMGIALPRQWNGHHRMGRPGAVHPMGPVRAKH